ncbi:hypothetical protein BpHYR1_006884, partial [Brachionus plicatilis]
MTISTEHNAEQSTNPESKCSMKTYAVTQQPASPYKKCKNYILGGDLNARTKQLGCLGENQNGTVLEKIINELDFS